MHDAELMVCTPITRVMTISPNASVGHIHMTQPRTAAMIKPAAIITAIAMPPNTKK